MRRWIAMLGRWTLALLGRVVGLVMAAVLAWAVFMLLPLLEQATRPRRGDLELRQITSADLPPPPPPPPAPEKEPEPEESPPELAEPAAPLDLAAIEMALNPAAGDAFGDVLIRLPGVEQAQAEAEADAIFTLSDLDQKPRPVSQPPPDYPAELRRRRIGGTVYVVFIVDRQGKVAQSTIEQAPHPQLGAAALAAVRRWRFEPGKRQGQPVAFKMRVPITFSYQ